MTLLNADSVLLPIDPALNACIIEDERIKNESNIELLQETLRTKLRPLIDNTALYNAIAGNIQVCVNKEDLSKAIEIVDAMLTMHSENQFNSFLDGAQVVMNDGGALFNTLKQNNILEDKVLAYHDQEKLPGISDASMQTGKIFNEVLFGVYKSNDGQIHTWFQIETSLYKVTKKDLDRHGELPGEDLMAIEAMPETENEDELAPTEETAEPHADHAHKGGHADEHGGHTTGDHDGHAADEHGGHATDGHAADEHGGHATDGHAADEHGGHTTVGHAADEHGGHTTDGHAAEVHGHSTGDHGHAAEVHEHTTGDHGHAAEVHEHTTGDHGHAAEAHEHATGDHGHAAEAHGHTTGDHGHAAEAHGHTTGDHGHAAEEHGHTTGAKSHVAAVKNKDSNAQLHH